MIEQSSQNELNCTHNDYLRDDYPKLERCRTKDHMVERRNLRLP